MRKNKKPLDEETLNRIKRKRKSNLGTFVLVLILFIGLGIMAYPTVSDWWNSFHASRAIASYSNRVESVDKEKLDAMVEAAKKYNQSLLRKQNPYMMTDEDLEEYNSLLDLSGTGIIGYITIKSIGVYIPIYHGTEESVLQIAIGHIDWTSLPVGGESTHSVVSGHRGLPSAKLFTDLDQMKEGDRFTITVTICAKQDNCPGQLLIGMISEYVRGKNYTDKVDMDAAFSSRPEQDGTICVTIGDEVVERILAFGFGGFDHQCLVEEQWEIDRGRMETVVEQTLGHIESGDMSGVVMIATIFGTQAVEYKFVLAETFDRQFVMTPEALLDS